MAHEIEIRDGQAQMMYAGELPWHGLGTRVETEVTAEAAIKLAGLDWECEKQSMFLSGNAAIDGIPVIGRKVDDLVAVVRKGDGTILGVVSDRYHIIQNRECFGFIDEIIGSGQAVFHTAASLVGGKKIFCTIKFPKDAKIGDDLINMYLLLSSSHDGKSALRIQWTPVRVVCMNTLNVALCGDAPASINVIHTTNYQTKIQQAREVLKLTDQYYNRMEIEFNQLLEASFTGKQMADFTKTLFPSIGDDPAGVTKNKRNKLVELFESGTGNKNVKGTKWAAFNSVTDFVDHHSMIVPGKGKNLQEARMMSSSFGVGSRLRQRAFDLLTVK